MKGDSNLNIFISILTTIVVLVSCTNKEETINWKYLESLYASAGDSTKLKALLFLKKEVKLISSEDVIFENRRTGEFTSFSKLDSKLIDERRFQELIQSSEFTLKNISVPDLSILTTNQIRHLIDDVFSNLDRLPWKKDLPENILFEYLLSYKISDEYPYEWRKELSKVIAPKMSQWLFSQPLTYKCDSIDFIDSLVNKLILPMQPTYYTYSANFPKLSQTPSYKSLKIIGRGDCYYEAMINNYLFKAAGIPSSFDVIPYWGSANGTHTMALYYNPAERKFRNIIGLIHSPAKVFRKTFEINNLWNNEIHPVVGSQNFAISFLKSNQLKDVTSEHTKTIDLRVDELPGSSLNYAYITVYNYGRWVPIFWGPTLNRMTIFKKMGINMIYRPAYESENGNLIYGKPLFVDSNKVISTPRILSTFKTISVKAINHGSDSKIKSGVEYILFGLDESGEEIPLKRQKALLSGILTFTNVAESKFYKVVSSNSKSNLSRFFSYNNDRQTWY